MQIFRELAGYSLGRADVVRRAMSKKKHDVMAREREILLDGLTDEDRSRGGGGLRPSRRSRKNSGCYFRRHVRIRILRFQQAPRRRLRDGGRTRPPI